MRSTTMLIASAAVALAACGPMTLQYVPVDPTTPVVTTGDTTTAQGERDNDRDDWDQRDKPAVEVDTTDHDAWERDKPDVPNDEERDPDWQDLDNEDEPNAEKPDLPTTPPTDPPAGDRPHVHPPAPQPDTARDARRPPPHVQPPAPQPDSARDVRRPPHVQPPRPDNPGRPGNPDTPGQPEIPEGARDIHIPPGHMPEGQACRLWIEGTPPGRQAPPVPCAQLHGDVPEGAFILYGDRVWDTLYDWVAHERRTPGSVPAAIVELMRSL